MKLKNFSIAVASVFSIWAMEAPASATLMIGQSVTSGDATITLTDCSALCATTIGQLVALAGPIPGFQIVAATGGAIVAAGQDLTVRFEVKTAADILGIGLNTGGSPNASTGETDFDSTVCGIGSGTGAAGAGTTAINFAAGYAACASPTKKDIFITKDISGQSGSVTSVTQTILEAAKTTPVPEPASFAILGFGLLGLSWFRRRFS